MILFLRFFFLAVLATILGVTLWASGQCPLFGVPREVATHPWFLATLTDAYLGFLTFYVWVAWRETTWTGRLTWLVAILLLGNIAMAVYALERLWQTPLHGTWGEVVGTRRTHSGWLGPTLALLGVGVITFALL